MLITTGYILWFAEGKKKFLLLLKDNIQSRPYMSVYPDVNKEMKDYHSEFTWELFERITTNPYKFKYDGWRIIDKHLAIVSNLLLYLQKINYENNNYVSNRQIR